MEQCCETLKTMSASCCDVLADALSSAFYSTLMARLSVLRWKVLASCLHMTKCRPLSLMLQAKKQTILVFGGTAKERCAATYQNLGALYATYKNQRIFHLR